MEYYICKQKTSLWTLLCYKLSRSWIWSCLLFSEHFWNTWEPAYGAQGWTRCPASRKAALSISGAPSVVVFSSLLFFQGAPFLMFPKSPPCPFLRAPFFVVLVSSSAEWSSKYHSTSFDYLLFQCHELSRSIPVTRVSTVVGGGCIW